MKVKFLAVFLTVWSFTSLVPVNAGMPVIKRKPITLRRRSVKPAKKMILMKPRTITRSKALMVLKSKLKKSDKRKLSSAMIRGRKLTLPKSAGKVPKNAPRFSDPKGIVLSPFKKPKVVWNGKRLGIVAIHDIMGSHMGFGTFGPSMADQAKGDYVVFPSFEGNVRAYFTPAHEAGWKKNVYAYQLHVTVGTSKFGDESFFKIATLNGKPIKFSRISAGQYGHLFYSDAKTITVRLDKCDGCGNRFYSISLKRLQ